jgi:hypothetical protein
MESESERCLRIDRLWESDSRNCVPDTRSRWTVYLDCFDIGLSSLDSQLYHKNILAGLVARGKSSQIAELCLTNQG